MHMSALRFQFKFPCFLCIVHIEIKMSFIIQNIAIQVSSHAFYFHLLWVFSFQTVSAPIPAISTNIYRMTLLRNIECKQSSQLGIRYKSAIIVKNSIFVFYKMQKNGFQIFVVHFTSKYLSSDLHTISL